MNIFAKPIAEDIVHKVTKTAVDAEAYRPYYGEGDAGEKIVSIITKQGGR